METMSIVSFNTATIKNSYSLSNFFIIESSNLCSDSLCYFQSIASRGIVAGADSPQRFISNYQQGSILSSNTCQSTNNLFGNLANGLFSLALSSIFTNAKNRN